MGWMEQGHLSPFHTCGSVRMNSTLWKNTSSRCGIWVKVGARLQRVIPGHGKLRSHRDYRHDDVNCLSPVPKRGDEMRRDGAWIQVVQKRHMLPFLSKTVLC